MIPAWIRPHSSVARSPAAEALCAMESARLLLNSKDGGLANASGQVGRNLSLHPNVKVVAIFDEPVTGWQGQVEQDQVRTLPPSKRDRLDAVRGMDGRISEIA